MLMLPLESITTLKKHDNMNEILMLFPLVLCALQLRNEQVSEHEYTMSIKQIQSSWI